MERSDTTTTARCSEAPTEDPPPERPDPFPHLADLSADQLLERRVEIAGQLKTLEQER